MFRDPRWSLAQCWTFAFKELKSKLFTTAALGIDKSQSLINWLLWRGYFGSLGRTLVAVAVVERAHVTER